MSLEWVTIGRRREEGHHRGREQLQLLHGGTECGRDEEKREACVVGCEKASMLCKMVLLFRP